jgi:hypothetical protein
MTGEKREQRPRMTGEKWATFKEQKTGIKKESLSSRKKTLICVINHF